MSRGSAVERQLKVVNSDVTVGHLLKEFGSNAKCYFVDSEAVLDLPSDQVKERAYALQSENKVTDVLRDLDNVFVMAGSSEKKKPVKQAAQKQESAKATPKKRVAKAERKEEKKTPVKVEIKKPKAEEPAV